MKNTPGFIYSYTHLKVYRLSSTTQDIVSLVTTGAALDVLQDPH